VRWRAAEALGDLADPAAVEPLVGALDDRERIVRERVVVALGRIGAVEPLIAALRDTSGSVRVCAAQALGTASGSRAVEALIAALSDEDWNVRAQAAQALGALGDPSAVEPLVSALAEGSRAVESVGEALGLLGPAALEPLVAALGNEDPVVRGNAAKALARLGDARGVDPLVVALADEHVKVRESAAQALGELGWQPEDAQRAQQALAAHDWDELAELGAAALEPLIAALGDEDRVIRKMAAWSLGRIGDARAADPLVAALGDEDAQVRERAAAALQQLGDAVTQSLISATGTRNERVLEGVTAELARRGGPAVEQAVKSLAPRLDSGNSQVRRRASLALARLGSRPQSQAQAVRRAIAAQEWHEAWTLGPASVEPLIAALVDGDKEVRRNAAATLGALGDPRAVEPLIGMLEDRSSKVRESVVAALGGLGDARAVEPLIAALGDVRVRSSVVQALGRLGDGRAVEPLVAVLEDEEAEDAVRSNAASALGELGALEALIAAADTNWRAVATLGGLDDPEALAVLSERLAAGQPIPWSTIPKLERLLGGESEIHVARRYASEQRAAVGPETLRAIGHLSQAPVWTTTDHEYRSDWDARWTTVAVEQADCSELRRLALQELDRRGLAL
jgi:HEAT repeat protein